MHRGIVLWRDPNHLRISTCIFSQNYLALPSFEVQYVDDGPLFLRFSITASTTAEHFDRAWPIYTTRRRPVAQIVANGLVYQ